MNHVPLIYNGEITCPRTNKLYKNLATILPEFFYPVHMGLFYDFNPRDTVNAPGNEALDFNELERGFNHYDKMDDKQKEEFKQMLIAITRTFPEHIVCAANYVFLKTPSPNIKEEKIMVVGARHSDSAMYTVIQTMKQLGLELDTKSEQGFINSYGVYRDRKTASKIVRFHNQPLGYYGRTKPATNVFPELYSEGLYPFWNGDNETVVL